GNPVIQVTAFQAVHIIDWMPGQARHDSIKYVIPALDSTLPGQATAGIQSKQLFTGCRDG
ncbi:MAG: hypothetical protein MI673_00130, partial [Thiotrichales bacterium]|nr:hypothetical protein [Thiotrichales bacterium]